MGQRGKGQRQKGKGAEGQKGRGEEQREGQRGRDRGAKGQRSRRAELEGERGRDRGRGAGGRGRGEGAGAQRLAKGQRGRCRGKGAGGRGGSRQFTTLWAGCAGSSSYCYQDSQLFIRVAPNDAVEFELGAFISLHLFIYVDVVRFIFISQTLVGAESQGQGMVAGPSGPSGPLSRSSLHLMCV